MMKDIHNIQNGKEKILEAEIYTKRKSINKRGS